MDMHSAATVKTLESSGINVSPGRDDMWMTTYQRIPDVSSSIHSQRRSTLILRIVDLWPNPQRWLDPSNVLD